MKLRLNIPGALAPTSIAGIFLSMVAILLFYIRPADAQTVDPAAVKILEASFDKVALLGTVSYRMTFTDTMGDGRTLREMHKDTVYARVSSRGNIFFAYADGSAKYVTKDTLFTFVKTPAPAVTATNNWDAHQVTKFSLSNLLGTSRKFASDDVDSITFSAGNSPTSPTYVIDQVAKPMRYSNSTVTSKRRYERLWIDKQTLLPVKRRMFSRRVDDLGRESVDIYEFTVTFTESDVTSGFPLAVFSDPAFRVNSRSAETYPAELLQGTLAPDLSALNLASGKEQALRNLRGKVLLLDFWYLSCPPCRQLMPVLNNLATKYRDKGLVVLGVNVKDHAMKEIRAYLSAKQLVYPQWYLPGQTISKFGLSAFPTTLLIDKNGMIKHVEIGFSEDVAARLSRLVEVELAPSFR